MNQCAHVKYLLVGYAEKRTCDRETQRELAKKASIIYYRGWKPLWESVRPSLGVNPRVGSEISRIEKATGEWRKPVKEEERDWSD